MLAEWADDEEAGRHFLKLGKKGQRPFPTQNKNGDPVKTPEKQKSLVIGIVIHSSLCRWSRTTNGSVISDVPGLDLVAFASFDCLLYGLEVLINSLT